MTRTTPSIDTTVLLEQLRNVELPTLGHFLEEGFCPPDIKTMVPGARMTGVAATVRIPDADAVAVNEALLRLQPGEVLVLDMGGDRHHAPVGAVTTAAARPGRRNRISCDASPPANRWNRSCTWDDRPP